MSRARGRDPLAADPGAEQLLEQLAPAAPSPASQPEISAAPTTAPGDGGSSASPENSSGAGSAPASAPAIPTTDDQQTHAIDQRAPQPFGIAHVFADPLAADLHRRGDER